MNVFGLAAGAVALTASFAAAVPAMGDAVGSPEKHPIEGTAGADTIRGTAARDWIRSRAGDDRVWALRGKDWIQGESGDDLLHGGRGPDVVLGGGGNDRLYLDSGSDSGSGMAGNDQIRGGQGHDQKLAGGSGRDRVWGGRGNDTLSGGRDGDRLWPGPGADSSWPEGGADRVSLREDGARDRVNCGPGSDVVTYVGHRDPADLLRDCEQVQTYVTTPGCVTAAEFSRVRVGMGRSLVHRIFETYGYFSVQRSPTDFGRTYRQCDTEPGFDECWADVDFRIGDDGVARVTGTWWESLCIAGMGSRVSRR